MHTTLRTLMDSFVADPCDLAAAQRLLHAPQRGRPRDTAEAAVAEASEEAAAQLVAAIRSRVGELLSGRPALVDTLCDWLPPSSGGLHHVEAAVPDCAQLPLPGLPAVPRGPRGTGRHLRQCVADPVLVDVLCRRLYGCPQVAVPVGRRVLLEDAARGIADHAAGEVAELMAAAWEVLEFRYESRAAQRVRRSLGCAAIQVVPDAA